MHLFACTLLLIAGLQAPAIDRNRAEALARSGHTAEALDLFKQIVQLNPADIEARLWVARLLLRSGQTADAEAMFRAVLAEHPADIDARIGLASSLTRRGDWQDALAILHEVEAVAGNNADAFAALARAYRMSGDDRAALQYYDRARKLSPNDPDLVMGYEAVARTYGHWIAFDGYQQNGASALISGAFVASLRVMPRLHLEAAARVQEGPDYSDTAFAAGIFWRALPSTTVSVRMGGGPDNIALMRRELSAEVVHYAGAAEIGGSAKALQFIVADVSAVSAVSAWTPNDRWRLDGRFTFSRTSFTRLDQSSVDNSVMIRDTWQGWRRVALLATYAYGIENFDDLTTERLRAFGANTVTAGLRIDTRSLTRITLSWEHQWRSNDTTIDRVALGVVQVIP